jgi:hypothetical protein
MNPFSRKRKLEEKQRKLAQQEIKLAELKKELERQAILNRKQQHIQENRNKYLIDQGARNLANEQIAVAEAQLEHEARKARKRAEDLRKDHAYQENQRIELERQLLLQQQQTEDILLAQRQQTQQLTEEAQRRIEEERNAREQLERRLQQQLNEEELRRARRQEKLARAEEEERERVKQLEEAQRTLEKKLRDEEMRRQRDEVENGNGPTALREIRELIRRRYELDMIIWRNRNDVEANRPLWQRTMVQSDAILLEIQGKVTKWDNTDNASGWTSEEWEMAKEIKERLLAPGKRNWAEDPPWSKGEAGPPKILRPRGRKKIVA